MIKGWDCIDCVDTVFSMNFPYWPISANYLKSVTEARDLELHYLGREMAVWATTLLMTVTSPVLATGATFTTFVLIDEGNILTASDTFGVLLLFSALRFPINVAGLLIGKAAQAMSAVRRIALFLERPLRYGPVNLDVAKEKPTVDPESLPTVSTESEHSMDSSDAQDCLLTLKKASFRIGDSDLPTDSNETDSFGFTVSTFDFSMAKGQVMAICGPVGCGKSTLINGILGEAEGLGETQVQINGPISYVPQTPFILNMSIRANILFGQPMDQVRYDKVLDACALRPDLEQLGEAGDLTEIGERGVTLSGGQKQRVSLARAAYNTDASIVILDDPFSALDSGTGKMVFERLISSNEALLKDKAVVLVTHASHFITHRSINKILLIVDGQNRFLGSWDEIAHFHPSDENTIRAVNHIKSTVREDTAENQSDDVGIGNKSGEDDEVNEKKGDRLIQVEQREHGLSSLRTWLLWFKRAGGWKFMSLQIIFMGLDRVLYVAVEFFLVSYSDDTRDLIRKHQPHSIIYRPSGPLPVMVQLRFLESASQPKLVVSQHRPSTFDFMPY